MANKLTDFFKGKGRTVKFGKEKKDDYDAKFERAKVSPTTVIGMDKTKPFAFLDGLSDDELKVRLDGAKGEEKARIKEILKTRSAAK